MKSNTKIPASAAARESQSVQVPRAWLVILTVLCISPWLAYGAYALWGRGSASVPPQAGGAPRPASTPPPGPWGQLLLTPITISPPIEYVPRTWGPVRPSVWTFPNMAVNQAAEFLVASGMLTEDVVAIRSAARPTPAVNGVSFQPEAAIVRRLTPDARARIYLHLGRAAVQTGLPINFDQYSSYRYFSDSIDDWLGTSGVSPATRQLVDPLIYRHEGFLYFADIELVRAQITNADELQLLAKRLLRQQTMLVSLQAIDAARTAEVTEYWGRGGRRTDIRPVLESITRWSETFDDPTVSVDVSHLLPSLVRQLLYRYPKVTVEDEGRPLLANCLWTALNFFNQQFDNRYLDVEYALARLSADYFIVSDGFQLGDVVAFTDEQGNLVHVAVFVADGLVFSKNGTSRLSPWSILPLERLDGHYIEYSDTWRVTYHRRKDL